MYKKINKIKVVLAEQHHTGKWLIKTMNKNKVIIYHWRSIQWINYKSIRA